MICDKLLGQKPENVVNNLLPFFKEKVCAVNTPSLTLLLLGIESNCTGYKPIDQVMHNLREYLGFFTKTGSQT